MTIGIWLIFSSSWGLAATDVGGPISSNTTWAKTDSPFSMTASVLVNLGVTLTIEAGCVINIGDNLGVQVSGTLVARGTSSQPIIFQSASGTTPGSWGSIGFSDTSEDAVMTNGTYSSGSVMEYCQVK